MALSFVLSSVPLWLTGLGRQGRGAVAPRLAQGVAWACPTLLEALIIFVIMRFHHLDSSPTVEEVTVPDK